MMRQWMSSRVVGLDIEASRVNYAEVSQHGGALTLKQGGTLPVGPGGNAEVLKALAPRISEGGIDIVCAISSPELVVRPFRFPRVAQKEFQKAIRMEAEAAILDGHTLEEMVIDWHRTGSVPREGMEGVLAVAPRAMVSGQMEMFHKAGLHPAVMDVRALALWNGFWRLTPGTKTGSGPTLLVNITGEATNLIVAQGKQGLFLVRDLEIEAHAATGDWLSEIKDSLAYARSKSGLKKLDAAYITGSGAQESLAAKLASAIGLPVPVWDPLRYLPPEQNGSGPRITDGRALSVAIGLALRKL